MVAEILEGILATNQQDIIGLTPNRIPSINLNEMLVPRELVEGHVFRNLLNMPVPAPGMSNPSRP